MNDTQFEVSEHATGKKVLQSDFGNRAHHLIFEGYGREEKDNQGKDGDYGTKKISKIVARMYNPVDQRVLDTVARSLDCAKSRNLFFHHKPRQGDMR